MKACLSILFIVALFAPQLASAQDKASSDLNMLLRDASYVFNRFEEVSGGVTSDIDTNYPVDIRKERKEVLSSVLRNVGMEKSVLNALLGRSKVQSADLLDVYTELVEVEFELDFLAGDSITRGDPKLAPDLQNLSSKAGILGAKLAEALRAQIVTQESQLAFCTQKAPRTARNHPKQ